ncbi:MAG: SLAC1 anion channel family protein [Spirochaetes bacterium]|nr:SLAC1 anion channel family protein [Spirochaetota bacterium]
MIHLKLQRLKYFPINGLAVILGITGFVLAVQKAEMILHLPFLMSPYLLQISLFFTLIFIVFYFYKIVYHREQVIEELYHPVKINFYPIIAKLLFIQSIIFLNINMNISKILWISGAGLQLFFSVFIVAVWMRKSGLEVHHLNPAWFIPIVGNVIAPIAGVEHGFIELSWFFFAIGIVMWIVLFVIVFNRIVFHHPLKENLLPTLFIIFAPPAIAFIAYFKLSGEMDAFARILYYISLFLFILIFAQIGFFAKIKFYISWWAYTFPVVAFTIATLLIYNVTKYQFFKFLGYFLLIMLVVIMTIVTVLTVRAVRMKKICIEE